jgi:hypothetical protein
MEVEHYSKEWDDAPMPHSVFFTKQGHAIHGSYEVKRLGSPASHGCVRLAPGNASKLFALVKSEGLANTKVVLTGSEQIALARAKAHRTASTARRDSGRQRSAPPNDDDVPQGYAPPHGQPSAHGYSYAVPGDSGRYVNPYEVRRMGPLY